MPFSSTTTPSFVIAFALLPSWDSICAGARDHFHAGVFTVRDDAIPRVEIRNRTGRVLDPVSAREAADPYFAETVFVFDHSCDPHRHDKNLLIS
jgi:hypothetical protein